MKLIATMVCGLTIAGLLMTAACAGTAEGQVLADATTDGGLLQFRDTVAQRDAGQRDRALPPPDQAPPPDRVLADQALPKDQTAPDQTVDVPPPLDAGADTNPGCPSSCSSCAAGVCALPCNKGCTCPPGWSCKISCSSYRCTGLIDCSQAISCDITCGFGACYGGITCGSGACAVSCGTSACYGAITCGKGACNVTCAKKAFCGNGVDCSQSCACAVDCDGAPCSDTTCPPSCGGCSSGDGCVVAGGC